MASFYAELRVGGYTYPVPRCTYAFSQATDARGRVATKVRHGLIELTLDVPDDDFLLAWAAAPYKPLAGCVVFFQDQGGPALETLSWEVGHCVGYQEQFEAGQTGQGAYVCHVTLAAERLTLRPGGPGAYVPPAPGSHGQPGQAAFLGQPSVGPEVLTPFAPLAAEAIISAAGPVLAPLVAAAAAGALAIAAVLGLILLTTTPAHAPGLPQPLVSPAELRLRELVAKQAVGTLTQDEEAELIALLAKVKGIHVQRLEDLVEKVPFGFPNLVTFKQVGDELKAALKESGLKYKHIGVRGSSVTGLSSKGGAFRTDAIDGLPASDIDVFIELAEETDLTDSKAIPGFIHPDKITKRYPALKQWSKKWTQKLGRDITPGTFKPGTFNDKNITPFQ